ncbi:MAG: transposase [Ulvibacter sp.]|jgi:transposase
MISHYRFIHLELKSLSNQIRLYCRKNHKVDYNLLRSVPAIAGLTASYILAEIGDVRRFSSFKKFASYVGFIPSMQQSDEGFILVDLPQEQINT